MHATVEAPTEATRAVGHIMLVEVGVGAVFQPARVRLHHGFREEIVIVFEVGAFLVLVFIFVFLLVFLLFFDGFGFLLLLLRLALLGRLFFRLFFGLSHSYVFGHAARDFGFLFYFFLL